MPIRKGTIKFCLACLVMMLVFVISSCSNNSRHLPITASTSTKTPSLVSNTADSSHPSTVTNIDVATFQHGQCYKSFYEFAYTLSDLDFPNKVLPIDPWQIEAIMPNQEIDGYSVDKIEVELARLVDGHQEIWLRKSANFLTPKEESAFAIYRPELQEWQEIPAKIDGTEIFVDDLFLSSEGVIWGQNTWFAPIGRETTPNQGPVLSRFNEHTQRFEFVSGILEIPFTYEQSLLKPKIILDRQDVIWIFAQNDGLYRYDPDTQTITKQTDLPDFNVRDSFLSTDGSIYIENYDFRKVASEEPSFRIYEGMLYQYIPSIRKLVELDIPNEPWPSFSGILFTQTGQLWLGAIGYQETDNTWHLIHPDPDNYFEHVGDYSWSPPHLMLESSNGLLWYQKNLDANLRNEGTAWYNPETGEGCMFTNIPSTIIEDSQQQLWMFADGKLYRYPLEP